MLEEKRKENEDYFDNINQTTQRKFQDFQQEALKYEKQWKRLKHNLTLSEMKEELKKPLYLNPQERNALYMELKTFQTSVYDKRKILLQELESYSIDNLSKTLLDKFIENMKNLNDQAQEKYDLEFQKLLENHNQQQEILYILRDKLKLELEDVAADLTEAEKDLQNVMEGNLIFHYHMTKNFIN